MSYKQLIEGQRHQIQAYLSQHLSYREIGRRLNFLIIINSIAFNYYMPRYFFLIIWK